jgi:hypothetical protein
MVLYWYLRPFARIWVRTRLANKSGVSYAYPAFIFIMKTTNRHRTKTYLEPGTVLLIKQIALGLLAFLVFGAFVALVWYGTRIKSFTIDNINISGGVTISHDEVKKIVEDNLSGTYLGIVPKRFAYFYPEVIIKDNISKVPRIKDVEVVRVSGTEIKVSFGEFNPQTLWCDKEDLSNCLFLDEYGFAFAQAPRLHGESMLRFVSPLLPLAAGTTPFIESDYKSVLEMVELLERIGWYVSRVEINPSRDVFYSLIDGGELRATLGDNPTEPFENIKAILGSKEFSHLRPGNFQYLDLRFGSRVFVNEELISGTASSTATTTEEVISTEEAE